jgi:hypothetical protein
MTSITPPRLPAARVAMAATTRHNPLYMAVLLLLGGGTQAPSEDSRNGSVRVERLRQPLQGAHRIGGLVTPLLACRPHGRGHPFVRARLGRESRRNTTEAIKRPAFGKTTLGCRPRSGQSVGNRPVLPDRCLPERCRHRGQLRPHHRVTSCWKHRHGPFAPSSAPWSAGQEPDGPVAMAATTRHNPLYMAVLSRTDFSGLGGTW